MFLRILVAGICLGGIVAIQARFPLVSSVEGQKFNLNEGYATFHSQTLRTLGFGYSRALSSALWLRFLQNTPPESLRENEFSWLYLDLKAVSEIDPDFKPVFSYGAPFLSVITEDRLGARLLLEEGAKRFPDDWKIRAYLAYHYQFELNLPDLAGPQYVAASRLPDAPPFLTVIAADHLAKRQGNAQGIRFLEELLENAPSPQLKERLLKKIKQLKERP